MKQLFQENMFALYVFFILGLSEMCIYFVKQPFCTGIEQQLLFTDV